MKTFQIVMDTNVLVSGVRSKKGASYQLISNLNDSSWQLNISVALILEYEEVLTRMMDELSIVTKDIDNLIDGICAISNKHSISYMWRPIANDADDDFLVDLAINAQADYIISYNKKDIQPVQKFGIEVVSPKEFLQITGKIS